VNGYIDIYCERTEPGLWAEPLNAISNLAFLVAAFATYRLARRHGGPTFESGLLIALILLVGAGSGLFHMLANRWSQLADVLPILFFQLAFIGIYAFRVMKRGVRGTAILFASYFALIWLFGLPPRDWLNGSLGYGPALLFLFGLGVYHYRRDYRARSSLLLAAGVFTVSLAFRSVDMWVCPAFPAGVHYLWHILNVVVLFLALQALLVNMDQPRLSDSH